MAEEIGRGVHASLPGNLKADIAYTLDGGNLCDIVYETFSADKATVTIQGVSNHPGQAKDTLVNALHLTAKIIDTLPHVTLTPETTDGRQGFIHAYQMTGMQNIHGPLEWISVQDMTRATEMCIRLAELWGSEQPAAPASDHTSERDSPADEGSAVDWVG